MLVCLECGKVFEENEAITVKELMGEFWGAPAYEHWLACPCCKSTEIDEYEEEEDDEEC